MITEQDKAMVVKSLTGLSKTWRGSQGTIEWIHDNALKDMLLENPAAFTKSASDLHMALEKARLEIERFARMIKSAGVRPDGRGAGDAPPEYDRSHMLDIDKRPESNHVAREFTRQLVAEDERKEDS